MPELDARQQQAVDAGPRDLFIAAGAGSGKTRVLTARFVAAIAGQSPYQASSPDALLTVTYTEKAAGELSERIRRELIEAGSPAAARRVSEAWISTIHGMCSRMIRRHALDLGIDPRFAVLDEVESSILETAVLDQTLGHLVEADPMTAEMVSGLSFPVVAGALRAARTDLSAAGTSASGLQTIAHDELDRLLRALTARARGLCDDFGALRACKTTQGNAAAARALADTLSGAMDADDPAPDILAAISRISFRQLRSIEGHEALVDDAKQLLDTARMAVAQHAVTAYEAAFVRALETFANAYAEEKRERGVLDFEDLQTFTARLLQQRPDVAERYRQHFAMLMVDEFQDTNALQLSIIERLADRNLCTVGDENQSIYSFRHADVEVFRVRGRSVAERVELDVNYRIAPPLLDGINGLFAHPGMLGDAYMMLRSPASSQHRPAWPENAPRFEVRFVDTAATETESTVAEAAAIAECVAGHIARGIEPGDVAVLLGALSRGQGVAVERELTARGIPATLAAGGAFLDCTEIHETRALLRIIDNVRNDRALLTVLAGRLTGLGADALYAVRREVDRMVVGTEESQGRPLSLWEALHSALDRLSPPDRTAAERLISVVQEARSTQGVRPLAETMMSALLDLGFDLSLFTEGSPGVRAWANVMKLVRMADSFESVGSGGLGSFLHNLDLREAHARGEQEAVLDTLDGAVRIMSIHAAKGLEFPVVVVGSLSADSSTPAISVARVDGNMLLGMMLPEPDGNEKTLGWRAVADARMAIRGAERRRLFYVACTRAKEGLTVVCRERSNRSAGDTVPGILRSILGMSEPDTLESREVKVGQGVISVTVTTDASTDRGVDDVGIGSDRPAAPMRSADSCREVPAVTHVLETGHADVAVPPVSYTALAAYERCPYHYHLTRTARLPTPPCPGTTAALDFGSALHLVLQRVSDTFAVDDVVDAAMTAAGVESSRRAALVEAADAFLGSPLARRIRAAERVEREVPFLAPLAGTVLSGAIDVLAWSGSRALIVDYKSGAGPLDHNEARDRYRLQAECYALAALNAGADAVEVVFAEVERSRETAFSYVAEDRPGLTERVSAPVLAIARGEFPPLDSYVQGLCDTCPGFGGLCPVTRVAGGASG